MVSIYCEGADNHVSQRQTLVAIYCFIYVRGINMQYREWFGIFPLIRISVILQSLHLRKFDFLKRKAVNHFWKHISILVGYLKLNFISISFNDMLKYLVFMQKNRFTWSDHFANPSNTHEYVIRTKLAIQEYIRVWNESSNSIVRSECTLFFYTYVSVSEMNLFHVNQRLKSHYVYTYVRYSPIRQI